MIMLWEFNLANGVGGDASQARLKRDVDLGKRITSNLVAELGKRPREMYSFGIGESPSPTLT